MPPTAEARERLTLEELAASSDEDLLGDLPGLADQIDAGKDALRVRLDIWRILSARGISQRRIGEAARVTPNAVGYALHTHGREPGG